MEADLNRETLAYFKLIQLLHMRKPVHLVWKNYRPQNSSAHNASLYVFTKDWGPVNIQLWFGTEHRVIWNGDLYVKCSTTWSPTKYLYLILAVYMGKVQDDTKVDTSCLFWLRFSQYDMEVHADWMTLFWGFAGFSCVVQIWLAQFIFCFGTSLGMSEGIPGFSFAILGNPCWHGR